MMKFSFFLILIVLIPSSAFAHESLLAHSHFMGEIIPHLSLLDYFLAAGAVGGLAALFFHWRPKK